MVLHFQKMLTYFGLSGVGWYNLFLFWTFVNLMIWCCKLLIVFATSYVCLAQEHTRCAPASMAFVFLLPLPGILSPWWWASLGAITSVMALPKGHQLLRGVLSLSKMSLSILTRVFPHCQALHYILLFIFSDHFPFRIIAEGRKFILFTADSHCVW